MSERLSDDPRSPAALTEAFKNVSERVARAANGRTVTLLAATKTVPADSINYAIDTLGLRCIGENRVQELLEKYDAIHKNNVSIHFIGRLQTNKVKYIIDKVDLIHSLDSERLADEIERQAKKRGKRVDALIEVNLAVEDSKGGIAEDDLSAFLKYLRSCEHIRVCGIMVIPPATDSSESRREYFGRARELFERYRSDGAFAETDSPVLSMGMSDSYVEALECGATLVRIGSALFGHRNYQKQEVNQ